MITDFNQIRVSSIRASTLQVSSYTLFTQGISTLTLATVGPGTFFLSSMIVGINCNAPATTFDLAGTMKIASTLTASSISINPGTLNVTGQTTLANTSNTGTLRVTGATTLGTLTVTGGSVTDVILATRYYGTGFSRAKLPSGFETGVSGDVALSRSGNFWVGIGTGYNSLTPKGCLDMLGGRDYLNGSSSDVVNNNIVFQFWDGGGFAHYITSRHNTSGTTNNSGCNSIDFWLNNSLTRVGSSQSGTGNINIMSITALGLGINCNAPAYRLDVSGTANFDLKVDQSYKSAEGKQRFVFYLDGATYFGSGNGNYHFQNLGGSADTLTINNTGDVQILSKLGIGTTPTYPLDVNGPAQAAIYYSSVTVGGTTTITPNNFGIFYNIMTSGTYTLAFSSTQASSNIGKYICVRNNCGSTLSFNLTNVSGIPSPVTLSNAQSATFVVATSGATTTTYALF
jgi:hypothetical protein